MKNLKEYVKIYIFAFENILINNIKYSIVVLIIQKFFKSLL